MRNWVIPALYGLNMYIVLINFIMTFGNDVFRKISIIKRQINKQNNDLKFAFVFINCMYYFKNKILYAVLLSGLLIYHI